MRSFLVLLFSLVVFAQSELDFTKPIGELRELPQQLSLHLRAEAGKYLARRPELRTEAVDRQYRRAAGAHAVERADGGRD